MHVDHWFSGDPSKMGIQVAEPPSVEVFRALAGVDDPTKIPGVMWEPLLSCVAVVLIDAIMPSPSPHQKRP